MANSFGCLSRPFFFLQAAAADAAAETLNPKHSAAAAGAPLPRKRVQGKSPSIARVFQLAEHRRAERVAEQAAERGSALQYPVAGCSWEAVLYDVRFVRVHARCLWWGVLAGEWSLIRKHGLHPQLLYHAYVLNF